MAITSFGYDGTVDEKQFEMIMGYSAHSSFGVHSPNAFAASNVAGQTLQVRLLPGNAWTSGVVDMMDAAQTVQLAAPPSSGSRWDMIVLRRNYQPPGGTTSLAVIKGTSSKTLPARENNPGVLSDQPLWLCRIDAGSGIVNEYIDLRVWARNGGCAANHDLVRSYMVFTGTMIYINGVLWLLRVGPNNVQEWVKPIELAMSAASTDAQTPNTHVKRNGSGNAAFNSVWLRGPQSSSPDAAVRKDHLDFLMQDHGHRNLYDSATRQRLYLDKDSRGAFLASSSVYGRTYDFKPNMYVTSFGTFGRSTVVMASKSDLDFAIQDHGHFNLYDPNTRASLRLGGALGDPFLMCDAVRTRTYSDPPNMFVTATGILGRSTASSSLRAYKENITPADINPADVLALEPVTYDRRDGTARGELGLIADDTEQLVPQLALYEDDRLEGVRYDRLAVAQQVVLRDQEKRLQALEARLGTCTCTH